MNCAEGEWWDAFESMWGDIFGRTDEHESRLNGCSLAEWQQLQEEINS